MAGNGSFIGYVGEPDFHDGSITAIERRDDCVRVQVRGASGNKFLVEFVGVQAVRSNKPDGMLLYALSEMAGQAPLRRFVFANWDDDGEAALEIDAEGFRIHRV